MSFVRPMGVLGLGALATGLLGAAALAQPAQYTTQDVIKAFSAPAETAAPASCPPHTAAGEDGLCDPVVESRGFSLAEPGSSAVVHRIPSAHVASRRRAAPRASVKLASAAVSPGDLLINFSTGSSELTGQGRANAEVFASALNSPALAGARFEISGHTDSTGSMAVNQTLSDARAAAVRAQLIADGVSGDRLMAKGYGSEQPVAGLSPRAAANRRVEARRLDVNS
jgi:OmpA-OmpF porin, OOP family